MEQHAAPSGNGMDKMPMPVQTKLELKDPDAIRDAFIKQYNPDALIVEKMKWNGQDWMIGAVSADTYFKDAAEYKKQIDELYRGNDNSDSYKR